MRKHYSKDSDSDEEKLHTNHHDKNQGEKEEEHKHHQPVSFTPTKREILGGDRPFRLGIFASSGSGKSHLISEMLTKEEWGVIQKFDPDRVFIICPTTSMDNSYDKVIAKLEQRSTEDKRFDKDKQVFEKELESALGNVYKQIFEEQKSKKLGKMKQDANLIILDDILLEIDLSSPHSMVARILTKCRHANISVLLSTQHLRATAPIARNQLSHAIFFSCPNHKEIAKIREELSGGLPSKQFDQIYNFATQKEHGYLLTCYAFPERYRFFSGQGSELMQIQV